ncbi:MAG: hypothetical protein QM640_09275 [Niabella sp.]
MRRLLLSVCLLALLGCTKQRLEKFNNRIIGNWNLVEINTFGAGSSNIVFDGGSFSFSSDHTLIYYDRSHTVYVGSWYIDAYNYQDDEGNTETYFILTLDVSDGSTRKFDQLEIPGFGNANKFKAKTYNTLNVVTYVFERD